MHKKVKPGEGGVGNSIQERRKKLWKAKVQKIRGEKPGEYVQTTLKMVPKGGGGKWERITKLCGKAKKQEAPSGGAGKGRFKREKNRGS